MADRRELTLLDTHIWIWSVEHDQRLSNKHFEIIDSSPENLAISVVSCWEIAMLVSKGRIKLDRPLRDWLERATTSSAIHVLPLTPIIAAEAYELPGTFHEDPADRLIVATARVHKCLLLTEDSKILDYSHVKTT
jgi:PIN domain nuclease of toxin-antitoxin system